MFGDQANPIADLRAPVTPVVQAASYDLLSQLNEEHLDAHSGDDALAGRIRAYEMAA